MSCPAAEITFRTGLDNPSKANGAKLDVKIEDGKVIAFRAKISLSFKYEE